MATSVAFILIIVSGVLFRYGVSKRGTRIAYLINFVAMITLLLFVVFAFKGCQDATSTFIRPPSEEPDTAENSE